MTDAGGQCEIDTPHSQRYAWYVVELLSVVAVFNYMDRTALAVLATAAALAGPLIVLCAINKALPADLKAAGVATQ